MTDTTATPDHEGLEQPYWEWLDEPPSRDRRLIRRTLVRLQRVRHVQVCDSADLGVVPGEDVIIDVGGHLELGSVTASPTLELYDGEPLPRVVRRATSGDAEKEQANRDAETDAMRSAQEAIRRRNLDMKIVSVHAALGANKMTVFFASEERIDFRDLVKTLGHRLNTRIEMRHIGARDETRLVGGIGVCGLELCCSSWLPGFAPVSIRMAKTQGLSLNTDKYQGVCGRLMCCLAYEQETYKEYKVGLPKVGRTIETPAGPGRVREVDVLGRRVRVELPKNQHRVFTAEELDIPVPEGLPFTRKAPRQADDPLGLPGPVPDSPSGDRGRRPSPRRADPTDATDAPWKSDDAKKRRRRRRRRGGAGGGERSSASGRGEGGGRKPAEGAGGSKEGGSGGKSGGRRRRGRRRKPDAK